MVPYAAKFGYTEEDLANNPALHSRLMAQYARDHGHEPTDSWILIVHSDETSDYFPFEDASWMWCCALAPLIRFLEYASIENHDRDTREANARAVRRFLVWSHGRGLSLTAIREGEISDYLEGLDLSPPDRRRHQAAIRLLFEWLVVGELIAVNPVAAGHSPASGPVQSPR